MAELGLPDAGIVLSAPLTAGLTDRTPALGTLAILAVAVCGIYGRSIDSPFIFDDLLGVVNNPSIVRLWPLVGDAESRGPLNPSKYRPTARRPLVNLTLALTYHFDGLHPGLPPVQSDGSRAVGGAAGVDRPANLAPARQVALQAGAATKVNANDPAHTRRSGRDLFDGLMRIVRRGQPPPPPAIERARRPLAREVAPIEVILQPGDALYLLSRWWHQTRSLDMSASFNFWWADGALALVVRAAEFVKRKRSLEIYGLESRLQARGTFPQ
jgi:hypothetical protein